MLLSDIAALNLLVNWQNGYMNTHNTLVCKPSVTYYSLVYDFSNQYKIIRCVLDHQQSLFFLSNETRETRKWPRAWLKARTGEAATPISCLFRRSRVCTPVTIKIWRKERLLVVYARSIYNTCKTVFSIIILYTLNSCQNKTLLIVKQVLNAAWPFP